MRKGWPARLIEYLTSHGAYLKDDAEVYEYGLQMGLDMLLNIISTLFIGFLMGMATESALFLVGYILLRTYAGGYHAESALGCYIQSCIMVACALLFCKHLPADMITTVSVAFVAVSGPVIFLLAPVAATHKPLDEVETTHYREKCRKRVMAEAVVLFVLLFLGIGKYALVLATGLFLIACLMVCGMVKNKIVRHQD